MGFPRGHLGLAVTNVICFIVVVVVAVVLAVNPQSALRGGFFCDDVTIRYPYHSDTVSVSVLVLSCFLPAVLLAAGVESAYGLLLPNESSNYTVETPRDTDSPQPKGAGIRTGLARAGILVACLVHGNGLCFVLTEVFKLSFGRLRPYFLSACQPETDVTSFSNCSSGWYIEDIVCLNNNKETVLDLRKSFVSGHASFAAFNMLFICLYLQLRLPTETPRMLVSLLQGVALGYGVFVCATRIYDNAHHPRDLLGGVTLAVLCVRVMIYKVCPDFVRHPHRRELNTVSTESPIPMTTVQK